MVNIFIKVLMLLMDFIRIDIFIVFGLYSLVFTITSLILKDKNRLNNLDELSSRFISFTGLIYFCCFLLSIILILCDGDEKENNLINRMFGPYWFAIFLPPLIYLIITQLLRLESIRKSKIIRLLFLPFLLITFEQFVILITSLNRDLMSSSWSLLTNINTSIFDFLFKIIKYVIFISLFYLITERLKK